MDENYAQKLAIADQSDVVDLLVTKYEDDTEIEVERSIDQEVDVEDVDISNDSVTDQFRGDTQIDKDDTVPGDAGYAQKVAYARQTTDVDVTKTEGFSRVQKSEKVKRLVGKVQKANKLVKQSGLSRRYVVTKADAPDKASVFEGAEGYFYFEKQDDYRPSNVTEYADKEHWVAFDDEDEQALFTVSFLKKKYPNAVDTIEDEDDMRNFLNRTLVDELDVTRDEDAFEKEFVDRLAKLMT